MKLLVISHNAIGGQTNMGLFLDESICGNNIDISQLYFYDEPSVKKEIKEYYRITDFDMLNSIFPIKLLKKNKKSDSQDNDFFANHRSYKIGKSREAHPELFLARNFIWDIGRWKTKGLNAWLKKINPDVIYFASGDFSFAYKIAYYVKEVCRVPLVTGIYDDYFFSQNKAENVIGKLKNYQYNKWLKRIIEKSSDCVYVNDLMKKKYDEYFCLNGKVIFKSSNITEYMTPSNSIETICYFGGLTLGRWESLISIGRELIKYDKHIDVYSATDSLEIIKHMTIENGIIFHGAVSSDEVKKIMNITDALIFVESFDEKIKPRIQLSLSTKISEYVSSGKVIFAYGPKDVGSIDYLIKNSCAIVTKTKCELPENVRKLINDLEMRKVVCQNANRVANQNHRKEVVQKNFYNVITAVCKNEDTIC